MASLHPALTSRLTAWPIALLIGAASAATRGAEPTPASGPPLRLLLSQQLGLDSNVLRQPDAHDPDRWASAALGLQIDRPLGRGSWRLHAGFESVRFQRHSELDHLAHHLDTLLLWDLAGPLRGGFGAHASRRLLRADEPDAAQRAGHRLEQWRGLRAMVQWGEGSWRLHAAGEHLRRQLEPRGAEDPAWPSGWRSGWRPGWQRELSLRWSSPAGTQAALNWRQGISASAGGLSTGGSAAGGTSHVVQELDLAGPFDPDRSWRLRVLHVELPQWAAPGRWGVSLGVDWHRAGGRWRHALQWVHHADEALLASPPSLSDIRLPVPGQDWRSGIEWQSTLQAGPHSRLRLGATCVGLRWPQGRAQGVSPTVQDTRTWALGVDWLPRPGLTLACDWAVQRRGFAGADRPGFLQKDLQCRLAAVWD